MNKKELSKLFKENLITEAQYKEELFKLATTKKPKVKKKLAVTVSEEDFIKIINKTKSDKHKLAFLLGFGSGLRISEIVGGVREEGDNIPALTKEKVNLQTKRIIIEDAKGGKSRIAPVPKGFKTKHLFMLPIQLTARALQIGFKNSCRKAGLLEARPNLHFHCLRSGFITHSLKMGVPIHQVRDLVGHSNISTTNIYAIGNTEDALKSYEDKF